MYVFYFILCFNQEGTFPKPSPADFSSGPTDWSGPYAHALAAENSGTQCVQHFKLFNESMFNQQRKRKIVTDEQLTISSFLNLSKTWIKPFLLEKGGNNTCSKGQG